VEKEKSPAEAGRMVNIDEIADKLLHVLLENNICVDAVPAIIETLKYKIKYLA